MQNPFALQIVERIEDASISARDFRALLYEFTQSLKDCVKREANESLQILAPVLASRNVSRASWVAEVCQAMVESGCDSQDLVRPLASGLKRAFEATLPLAAKLEKKLAPKLAAIEDPEKARRWIESAIRQLAVKLPKSVGSLKTIERFCHLAFQVYGQQVGSRPKVWKYLESSLGPMARWSRTVEDLRILLNLLENEPLVVIDLANKRGFVAKFGGMPDNVHFITLLMDTFVQQVVFGKPLVSYDVAQCAKGIGPCHVSDEVHGAWNVYTYRALNEMQRLPDPKDLTANKHWLWNDQTPNQIPVLHGHRIVFIGPPSYPRQWTFTRKFQHVSASIQVDYELNKLDLQMWLDRVMQANQHSLETQGVGS
ncbi:MAG: hypothetical protein JNK57_15515 [Planctomycetaceae bacterium]|nr:hypothetical protein [Planctomycetaceae bacterium]